MKIEAGKCYRTEDGRNTGVIYEDGDANFKAPNIKQVFCSGSSDKDQIYNEDGMVRIPTPFESGHTIIAEWTEGKTLAELDVKPGDVVEFIETGKRSTITHFAHGSYYGTGKHPDWPYCDDADFRLISRAAPEPKTWGEMTPDEKGACALALIEGRLQYSDYNSSVGYPGGWNDKNNMTFFDDTYYRIKPEPVVEEVEIYGGNGYGLGYEFNRNITADNTHRITFNTIDGKPDCSSVKMEEV